ncbi:MAG: hypothetical protein WCE52_04960 [Candidatus Acidiferrum sp.]
MMPTKTHFEKVTLEEVKRIMELRAKLEAKDDLPAEPIVIAVKESEVRSAKVAQGKGVLG